MTVTKNSGNNSLSDTRGGDLSHQSGEDVEVAATLRVVVVYVHGANGRADVVCTGPTCGFHLKIYE